jgi:ABC-2 type transport system ATP-binding protein
MSELIVKELSKTYDKGKVIAVDKVSFTVNKGEIFGLIGPDGAGKTSIIRMLTTLLLPDSGSATLLGKDVVSEYKYIRLRSGYMPGRFSLYQDLSIEENLTFFATVFNTTIEQNYDLIRDIYVQIEPFKKRKAGQLSGGMKQKLALCCALIHKPELLFLDEPTTGIDAVSRKEFWEMLKRLKEKDITMIVSTPYMDEANLCDRIALIQSGKIMTIDTPENITKAFPTDVYAVKSKDIKRLLKDLRASDIVDSCYPFGEYLHVTLKEPNQDSERQILKLVEEKGHKNPDFKKIDATIEDCFIHLMRKRDV